MYGVIETKGRALALKTARRQIRKGSYVHSLRGQQVLAVCDTRWPILV